MSDFRSVAAVTATLSQHIQTAINATPTLGGTTVVHRRPDAPAGPTATASRVNVFLFQTIPNTAFRAADTPTRRSGDGSLIQRPRAPLDLQYLISFYGDEAVLRPQTLLGAVVAALHASPILTREMIADTVANPLFAFLAGADLADEVERVKLTPLPLSLEDLSRTWSVFFQVPYVLSTAYQASVVFVEQPEVVAPVPVVLTASVTVRPGRTPLIETIGAEGRGLLVDTSVLVLSGHRLRATEGETRVRLTGDGSETPVTGPAAPAGSDATDDAVRLPLETHPNLRAGTQGGQIIHYLSLSEASPTLYPVFSSDVAAFVLHPRVTAAPLSAGNMLNVSISPPVSAGQSVQAELIDASGAVIYIARGAPPAAETGTLSLPTTDAPPGTWRVRARVDGAESPLSSAPEVTIP